MSFKKKIALFTLLISIAIIVGYLNRSNIRNRERQIEIYTLAKDFVGNVVQAQYEAKNGKGKSYWPGDVNVTTCRDYVSILYKEKIIHKKIDICKYFNIRKIGIASPPSEVFLASRGEFVNIHDLGRSKSGLLVFLKDGTEKFYMSGTQEYFKCKREYSVDVLMR
jgi:hypothetical protein